MSVKTGVLGSCGSSQEGYQILSGAEGIFLGKLMTELSGRPGLREEAFHPDGTSKGPRGWDVRLEDRDTIRYERPCVLPE